MLFFSLNYSKSPLLAYNIYWATSLKLYLISRLIFLFDLFIYKISLCLMTFKILYCTIVVLNTFNKKYFKYVKYFFVYTYALFSCALHDVDVASVQEVALVQKVASVQEVASVQRRAHHGSVHVYLSFIFFIM